MPTNSKIRIPAAARNTTRTRRGFGVWTIVVSVVVLGVVGIGIMSMGSGSDGSTSTSVRNDLGTAETRSFTVTTLANGELEAKNRLELRNRVESQTTIIEIVPEGTMVQEGDVLVRLNDEDLRNRIAEEELRVVEATSSLAAAVTDEKIQISENESKLRNAQSKLSIARLTYQQWEQGEVVKKRKELELAVEKAEKNLERLSSKWTNSQELYANDFLSKDELDRDEIAYIEAVASVETTRLDMLVYNEFQYHKDAEQKRRDVEEAEAELERVTEQNEINLRQKEANKINRTRQLQLRQEKLAKLREQLEFCTVTAPRAGLVVYGSSAQRNNWRWQQNGGLAVGSQVGNNDLLIVLPDTTEMTASVKVHESIAGRVRPGQSVTVSIEAIGAYIPGVVDSIGVLAETGGWRDPNRREYTVKIDLDRDAARDAALKPTMRCEARVELGRVEDVLAVPVPAVFNDGPVRYVLVPDGSGRVERHPVQLGRTSDSDAEIVAGLEAGDRVLLRDPTPGEVSNPDGWDQEALELAGYSVDERGNPVAPRRGRPRAASGG